MATEQDPARHYTPGGAGSGDRVFGTLNIAFMILLVVVMIIPFVNVLAVAFSSRLSSLELGIKLWPSEWSVEGKIVV